MAKKAKVIPTNSANANRVLWEYSTRTNMPRFMAISSSINATATIPNMAS